MAALVWNITGRTLYKYAQRLGDQDARTSKLREMGANLTKACKTLVRHLDQKRVERD